MYRIITEYRSNSIKIIRHFLIPGLGLELWKDFKSLVGEGNFDNNYTVELPI